MSDKIMDVRSCIDAAVSPEGLKTGGGGGSDPHVQEISIEGITNKTEFISGGSSEIILFAFDNTSFGILSINKAMITTDEISGIGFVEIAQISPVFPPSTNDEFFCINGDNGKNYLGKIENFRVKVFFDVDTESIPSGTRLIFDTTQILNLY